MEVSSLAVVLGVGTGVLFLVQADWSGHFIAPFCSRTARAASEGRLSEPHGRDRDREHGVREAGDPANQGPAISTMRAWNPTPPDTEDSSLQSARVPSALVATHFEAALADNCRATLRTHDHDRS